MPRSRAEQRMAEILEAATELFIERGYRRARMSDVADRLNVTEPALYRYFESKEALFDAVVRNAMDVRPETGRLPLPTPAPGATLSFLRAVVETESRIEALDEALRRQAPPPDAEGELEQIIGALVDTVVRNRVGLKIVERTALDWPELAALWFGEARSRIHADLAEYLARRGGQGSLRSVSEPAASARLVLEVVAYAGMHLHTDPFPTGGDGKQFVRATLEDLVHAYRP